MIWCHLTASRLPRWLCVEPVQETRVWFLSQEDPLEKEMATYSSILGGNPVDRGAWQAAIRGVAKNWTWLSDWERMRTRNCTASLEMHRCVAKRWRCGICEHIGYFATIPQTHNLKDVYEIFPISFTSEEPDFPIIISKGQIQKINLIIKC